MIVGYFSIYVTKGIHNIQGGIIINQKSVIKVFNRSNLSDYDAMAYVMVVIKRGQVSKNKEGDEQYTFVTEFEKGIYVYSERKRNTYTFVVDYLEEKK